MESYFDHQLWSPKDSGNKDTFEVGIFMGPPSIENDAQGIEKLLLKTQVSEKVLA